MAGSAVAGRAEPLPLEPGQPDGPEPLVERSVDLEDEPGEDADDDGRVDRRQEVRPAVEPPARDPLVDQEGQDQRDERAGPGRESAKKTLLPSAVQKFGSLSEELEVAQPDPDSARCSRSSA